MTAELMPSRHIGLVLASLPHTHQGIVERHACSHDRVSPLGHAAYIASRPERLKCPLDGTRFLRRACAGHRGDKAAGNQRKVQGAHRRIIESHPPFTGNLPPFTENPTQSAARTCRFAPGGRNMAADGMRLRVTPNLAY